MTERQVRVEQYIEQVEEGCQYKGTLRIAETKFDYELTFRVPILQLYGTTMPGTFEEIRCLVVIAVKQSGAEIKLTNEEYCFFFVMLGSLALELYYGSQIRDSNKGVSDDIVFCDKDCTTIFARKASWMFASNVYPFSPKLCEMLSSPRFDCALS